jgi:hypothetical protein
MVEHFNQIYTPMFVSSISDITAQSQLMGTGLKNKAITLPLASDDVLNCFIILVWITITALLYLSSSNLLT